MSRRQTLQALAAAAIAVTVPQTKAFAAEDVQVNICRRAFATLSVFCCKAANQAPVSSPVFCTMQFKTLSYPTLAFEFQYPVTTETGRKLPVIISRKPERYSSAAPMTADARQRIVTELVDFPDGITISVSVSLSSPHRCYHTSCMCAHDGMAI